MLFNSLTFAIFLSLVFVIYWALARFHFRWQNLCLVLASYVFYGWWDWRFTLLLCFSSTMDYGIGRLLGITESQKRRKMLILASIALNIGLLGFFKYFNFFVGSAIELGQSLGFQMHASTLNIILPVGLSFYTFQSLGYTLDVYWKKVAPTRHLIDFQAYVSFFPQLVAGPIERAGHMLPQFQSPRSFDLEAAKDGMRQMLWGFFKKIVIADNCAVVVNPIFDNPDGFPASALVVGAVCFVIQAYGDFSGYSDIALGAARLLGINLMRNFAYPFFSRNMAEFWRRWNISIMSWFRDYIFFPLGGSREGKWKTVRNILIVFFVSGLWHGAAWTYVIFGVLNGVFLLRRVIFKVQKTEKEIVAAGRWLPSPRETMQMLTTFTIFVAAIVIFRSPSMAAAFDYYGGLFQSSLFTLPVKTGLADVAPFIIIMFVVEWLQRERQHGLQINHIQPRLFRWLAYYALVMTIIMVGGEPQTFIYFQF